MRETLTKHNSILQNTSKTLIIKIKIAIENHPGPLFYPLVLHLPMARLPMQLYLGLEHFTS